MRNFAEKVSFIWSIADLLRGDYKPSEYGRVILPFLVLRRLDGASKLDFAALLDDRDRVAANLVAYVRGSSSDVRDILDKFRFEAEIARLEAAKLLPLVIEKFAALDLGGPDAPDGDVEMGYIFEELIRKFAEQSNATAGEHYTPREVIRLMVALLFAGDATPGAARKLYDPACGTGGMLSVAAAYLSELDPEAHLEVYGQELNGESYAICAADALVKGQPVDHIRFGNSLSDDGLPDLRADYLISNPPFGVDWSKAEEVVRAEHAERGHDGRFGPGLPRRNDGSLLFLLHMLAKMKPREGGGSRLAIVFNGSPLFAGGPGSGESEIRRWVIENDWLEAIIALPDQLFYNTAIATYVWVVTNHKAPRRRGKIQLIDGTRYFERMQKSLGDKRKALSDDHIRELTRLHDAFEPGPDVRILDNQDFGFRRITVERPQKSGRPDPELREHEDVPLKEDVAAYFEREVRPHVPDAWVDHSKTKVGYTIPFARHFHVYEAPRSPEVIEAEIRQLETEIQEMLREALR